ncbi:MAG: Hpt domain-containing protein, partial [Candidatus Marinimicrobia bacterium]|nr:Hpt domain-containing protein [Candidatus Neomarinimicrobiota bacterium]
NIFNGFTEEFPQNMQTLKDCIKNEDFENLGFVSHEIKGSSANLGAKSLSEICHTIEMKAKSEDITNLEEDIDALEKMFDSTKIEFDKYISEKRRME